MSGTSLGSRGVEGVHSEPSKPSSIVQKLFRMGRRSTTTSRTEPHFVSKYESRGFLYDIKNGYAHGRDQGRILWKPPYEYRPLVQGEIRLLELLPGTLKDVVECRVYHGVLGNLPRYEALSYTWGDDSAPKLGIFVDEKVFLVKDNLKEALRSFQPPTQQKLAENSAEEFLRYWERIRLYLDHSEERKVLISHNEGQLVRSVGGQGQEEYERYMRLVRRAKELHLPSSSDPGSTKEIKCLLTNLDQRRQQLQALWNLHATKEGKTRVTVNSRLMWIDAICINQADLDERIAQIKIMRQIYQSANSVVVWLGDDDGDGGTAIELISRISHKLRSRQEESVTAVNFFAEEIGVSAPWYSLAFFFSSPWFHRSWVVQECVASAMSGNSRPILYYGPRCISWNTLEDLNLDEQLVLEKIYELVAETWKFHPRHYPFVGDVFGPDFNNPEQGETCVVRHDIGDTFQEGLKEWLKLSGSLAATETHQKDITKCSLVFWLMRIRSRQATNPLDKIYSVLGLVEDLHGNKEPEDTALNTLIVDYRVSAEDVYSSLVRAVVLKTKNLQILGACGCRSPLIQRTWTPDWTQPHEYNLSCMYLMDNGIAARPRTSINGFDASSGRECNVIFADDLSTMSAEGISWDTISIKTTTLDTSDARETLKLVAGHLPEIFARELLGIWDRLTRGAAYTDDVFNSALWGTLLVRFSLHAKRFELYQSCPPSALWTRQFNHILEESKGVDNIEIPTSWLGMYSKLGQASLLGLNTEEDIIQTLKSAIALLLLNGGTIMATEKGYIGEATNRCQIGDIVSVLLGCNFPVILRPVGDHYEFVGEVYLHGIMHGEVIRAMEEGKVQSQVFELH